MKTAISMNACPILLAASLFLVAIPPSGAQSGHIQLLTVAETPNGEVGGLADLYLDVRPGSGAIFIDSYPLTRIDTQISTRYANEIACDLIQEDCTKYDFFYTIRASSSVVGGPSAGAPIAALTASVLGGLALAKDTIMTGTITSGGVIGPVAGVPKRRRRPQREATGASSSPPPTSRRTRLTRAALRTSASRSSASTRSTRPSRT